MRVPTEAAAAQVRGEGDGVDVRGGAAILHQPPDGQPREPPRRQGTGLQVRPAETQTLQSVRIGHALGAIQCRVRFSGLLFVQDRIKNFSQSIMQQFVFHACQHR